MSFDIFFQPCRYSGKSVDKKNPFTGEVQPVRTSEPITPAELRAVRAVFEKAKAPKPNDLGFYVVEFDGGITLEVNGDDLDEGCMVVTRSMTPDIVKFLFDLLKAGGWVMLPAMEDAMAITALPERLRGIPDDYPKVVVCNSAEELGKLLSGGFADWQQYRDQVVGGND